MRKGENKMQLIVFAVVFVLTFIVSAPTYLITSDRNDDLGLGPVLGISAVISAFVAGVAVILSGAVLGIRNLFRAGKR
jgi:steroid 5-alpha reductase family enzyme